MSAGLAKLKAVWLVAAGAFIGSAARLLVTLVVYNWWSAYLADAVWILLPTLLVNITGSLALGYLAGRVSQSNDRQLWLFWGAGCLSSYTTFSGFALDLRLAAEQGSWFLMSIYGFSSVLLSIAAAGLGFYWATRHVETSC